MIEKNRKIVIAGLEDLKAAVSLYSACSKKMNLQGLFNWNEAYPDEDTVKSDIDQSLLWKLDDPIKGLVSLALLEPSEYKNISWNSQTEKSIVIRRLAVHPNYQGQGIAKKIMREIEAYTKNRGYSSIRLDVFSESLSVVSFYKKLAYVERGSFYYEGYNCPFIAMEKTI